MVKKEKTILEVAQPLVNIGLVGHVDHGKSSVLLSLSGKWTDTHSEEVKRGITIKLGYADADFYKCEEHGFNINKKCDKCERQRKVSFIDAPGHETLMATMLSGSAIMDGALLLVSANEECPQPQTKEHLMALEVVGVKYIVIVQNKIDLVTKEEALKNYEQIKKFLKGTIAENSPIIPVSAKFNVNVNYLIEAIQEVIPNPQRDPSKDPLMFVARSFDVNKPGSIIKNMSGGVLGGSLKQGIFKVGDKIEIGPGRLIQEKGMEKWITIKTEIISLVTGSSSVDEVVPGGSIAMQTNLDPSIVKSDQLSGSVVSLVEKLPPVWLELKLEPQLLARVVGVKEDTKVEPIKKGEPLVLNVNAMTTSGVVVNLEKKKIHIRLKRPVCTELGSKVAISRRVGMRWHLVGWAIVKK